MNAAPASRFGKFAGKARWGTVGLKGCLWFAHSLPLFSLCRLTQADTGATAVFVDELDARRFKGARNDVKRCAPGLT